MAKHTIEIFVSNGNITYSNPHVIARRGDDIEWLSRAGHIGIHFAGRIPMNKGRYHAQQNATVSDRVRNDTAFDGYKYFVAVCVGNDVWTDDPDIIIRP